MKIIPALFLLGLMGSALPAVADDGRVRQCKSYVQGRIDVLDAQMRKGYDNNSGRRLVERRDKLRAQYKRCEKNPDAYKKPI